VALHPRLSTQASAKELVIFPEKAPFKSLLEFLMKTRGYLSTGVP